MIKDKRTNADFLLEIGTEELPAKTLHDLITNLAIAVEKGLQTADLSYTSALTFATPRRLAVIITQLAEKQKDRIIEKRGPALTAAFDDDGNPTDACLGFANSCGVAVAELEQYKTSAGAWVLYRKPQKGASVFELIPKIITEAVENLPIVKPMRWGENTNIYFVRPVRWVVMLYGKELVETKILGITTQRKTYGHKFHHSEALLIPEASQYVSLLQKTGKILVDLDERKEAILQQLSELAKNSGTVVIDDDLLNETTGLTEWPVALMGGFDSGFLDMPVEALKAVMKNRQKCFYLVDDDGKLLPRFITICNIESKDPERVIKGNERVMHARLSDLKFFYEMDLKQPLENYVLRLKDVVYQAELGTLYDKANRLETLAVIIANEICADVTATRRAAHLAKADLTTEMVKELPDLQGIISYYYALKQNESQDVATAIKEHYLPRFSGDHLPSTSIACAVAIADRIDHLFGAFVCDQIPTAEKDPFGLRRAALALIRIIIEKQLSLNLKELFLAAGDAYKIHNMKTLIVQILDFIFERLRSWYLEQGIPANLLNAVFARATNSLLDCKHRIDAIQYFQTLPQSATLIIAYKRVNNILKKAGALPSHEFNSDLFVENAEKELALELAAAEKIITPLFSEGFYTEALKILTELKTTIDKFFDTVMVMVENEKLRDNRLALLMKLKDLFSRVADISLL